MFQPLIFRCVISSFLCIFLLHLFTSTSSPAFHKCHPSCMKAFNDSAEAFLDFTRIKDVKKHGETKPASLGMVVGKHWEFDSCFYCFTKSCCSGTAYYLFWFVGMTLGGKIQWQCCSVFVLLEEFTLTPCREAFRGKWTASYSSFSRVINIKHC